MTSTLFPYPVDPEKGFDAMEADALRLERMARDAESSANAIARMLGSKDAVRQLRADAAALRRAIAVLGFVSGRIGTLHRLYEPVRRETSFGGARR